MAGGVCAVVTEITGVGNVVGGVCIVVSHGTEAGDVVAGVCVVVTAGTLGVDGAGNVADVGVGIAAGGLWITLLPSQSISVRSAPFPQASVAKLSSG